MEYKILKIINAFSKLNLLEEIEIETLYENLYFLKNKDKYKELLKEINFDENNISQELIEEISNAVIDNEVFITKDNYLAFTMNDNLREEIIKNIKNKNICLNFMDDFMFLIRKKEENEQLRRKINYF